MAPDRAIPMALERVILRAMAKEPDKRYPSMMALVQGLEGVLRGSTAETRLPPVADEHWVGPTAEGIRNSAPLELERPSRGPASAGLVGAEFEGERARPGRGKAVAAAGTALLLAVGIVGMVMRGPTQKPQSLGDPGKPPSIAQSSNGMAANGVPGITARPLPPDPGADEVLLDTNPPGAIVYANGQRISETPGLIRVPPGTTLEVLMRKEGYAPKQVRLDSTDKRLIVPLERVHHAGPHPLPIPVIQDDGPAIRDGNPPAVKRPARGSSTGTDPGYEALPPPSSSSSKKTPTTRPGPPRDAPLDPYQ